MVDQNQAIMDVKKSVYLIFIITLGAVLDSIFGYYCGLYESQASALVKSTKQLNREPPLPPYRPDFFFVLSLISRDVHSAST